MQQLQNSIQITMYNREEIYIKGVLGVYTADLLQETISVELNSIVQAMDVKVVRWKYIN